MKGCPKTTKIVLSYTKSGAPFTTLGGTASLVKRLDEVIGVKVKYVNVRGAGTDTGGFLFTLNSFQLGSMVGSNPIQIDAQTDVTALNPVAYSTVIGFGGFALNAPFIDNAALKENLNCYLPFPNPCPLQQFDWFLAPLSGTWTLTASYTIEIVLEFTHLCHCKNEHLSSVD